MTAATVARDDVREQGQGSACSHGPWKYVGPATDPRPGSACERPVALCCLACGLVVAVDCHTSRSASCGPCGLRYRANVQRIARVHAGLLFWTLTAPGRRAHSIRNVAGAWVPCPCTRPGGVDLARWNAGAALAFSRMLNNGVRRDPRFAWLRGAYFRATETQKRGALHYHLLVQVRPGVVVTEPMLADLTELAMAYGFGHRCDVESIDPGRGAHYVAKYVGKASNERHDVPWAREKSREVTATVPPVRPQDIANGWVRHLEPRPGRLVVSWTSTRATYRTWSTSRDWPNTMRALRAAQEHYAHVLGVLPDVQGGADAAAGGFFPVDLFRDRPDVT